MTGLKRARGLCLAAAMVLCLVLPAAGVAAATSTYTRESQQAFESQLGKGEIATARINKRLGRVDLVLKDGRHVYYHYPKKGSEKVDAELTAKSIPVTVLSPSQATAASKSKPVKHKLRYIVGGVLIVVIVIVGVVLVVNRRRRSSAD